MRLFIAVDLGPAVREQAERQLAGLARQAPHARWAHADTLHVTLAFLGEVGEERVPPLQALVTEVARRHAPLTLQVGGGGAFGSPRRPKVLWVGMTGEVDRLRALQQALAQGLAPLGHPLDARGFSPHLTFARAKDPRGDVKLAACVQALHGVSLGEARVDRLILYQSELRPEGARHTPLVEAPLRGGPPEAAPQG